MNFNELKSSLTIPQDICDIVDAYADYNIASGLKQWDQPCKYTNFQMMKQFISVINHGTLNSVSILHVTEKKSKKNLHFTNQCTSTATFFLKMVCCFSMAATMTLTVQIRGIYQLLISMAMKKNSGKFFVLDFMISNTGLHTVHKQQQTEIS